MLSSHGPQKYHIYHIYELQACEMPSKVLSKVGNSEIESEREL